MALKRLEHSGYKVADGSPDIRGWSVMDSSGGTIGKVNGLLFDDNDQLVRYALVDSKDRGEVMLPIGQIDVDDDARTIRATGIGADRVASLPTYNEGSFNEEYERNTYKSFVPSWNATDKLDYHRQDFRGNVPKTIQLLEEQLRVGKRSEKIGEVTATKRPVTETVSEKVELVNERIDIQRTPVNRPVESGQTVMGQAETIRVPLYGEEAVAQKSAFVKEDVTIDKKRETRTDTVSEQVVHEELVVDEGGTRRELSFAGTEPTEEDLLERQRLERNRRATPQQDIDLLGDRDRLI